MTDVGAGRSALVLRRGGLWRQVAVVSAAVLAASGLALAASAPAEAAGPPWDLTDLEPDATAVAFGLPGETSGNTQELGPVNGSASQFNVLWQTGQLGDTPVTPNDDFTSVWLDSAKDGSNVWIYMAWELETSNGSGTVMFEFQHAPRPGGCSATTKADLISGCNPWAGRDAGDFVLVWDYTGSAAVVHKRTFQGSRATGLSLGAPEPIANIANVAAFKQGNAFGEGAVNLTALGVFPVVPTTCSTVANVIPSTITGNSTPTNFTADVKDIVLVDPSRVALSNCSSLATSVTGTGMPTRTVSWDLAKSVTPATLSGAAGDALPAVTWDVRATKTETTTHAVTGTVSVTNPNPLTADGVAVTAKLGTADVAVTCPKTSLGPSEQMSCTFSGAPTSQVTALSARATSTTTGVPAGTSTGTVDWQPSVTVGTDSADLSDPRLDLVQTISASQSWTPTETFTCPTDPASYTDGTHTRRESNTATLTVAGVPVQRSAHVDITCTRVVPPPLTLSGAGSGAFDRTATWALAKSVDDGTHSGVAGGAAGTSRWTVSATKSVVDDGHRITGDLTVGNPASIARQVVVTAAHAGGAASVTCPASSVPAGGQLVCTVVADVGSASVTSLLATVSSPGLADVTASVPVAWTAVPRGDDTVRLTDERLGLAVDLTGSDSYTLPETFSCPSASSAYPAGGGPLVGTETNTAGLRGATTDLTRSAQVVVTCAPAAVLASGPTPTAGPTPVVLPFVDTPQQLPRTGGTLLPPLAGGSAALLVGALLVGAARARREQP